MTKGNNNQQRDADFHFLCIIPTGKSQSAVNYHFALYPITMVVTALHWQNPWRATVHFIWDPKLSSRDQVTEFRQEQFTVTLCLHGYFCIVFCSFLLPQQQLIRVRYSYHEKLHRNIYLYSFPSENRCKDCILWDVPNRLHYTPNTVCPGELCQLCDR